MRGGYGKPTGDCIVFELRKIVAWRYDAPEGMSCILTPKEAEERFQHSELYGRTRAPYLTPIFEREKAPAQKQQLGLVVSGLFG